jgi:predicted enzyme related to lactoylglutathione lyase
MADQGIVLWNELMTDDVERAKKFYDAVVGWKTKPMSSAPGNDYTLWLAGDKQAGGVTAMAGPQFKGVPPHWRCYVAVPDVDAAAKKAAKAGGKVVTPPFDVPNVGRVAVIADPAGAVLGIMTPARPG